MQNKSNKFNDIQKNSNFSKKRSRRISEVVPIYTQLNKLKIKGNHEIENLLINNQESILYNNINILKTDLPNIVNNLNSIEQKNNKVPTVKSMEGKKHINKSRNFDIFNNSLGDSKNLDNEKFKTTIQLRRLTQNKKNKYSDNENDNNSMNISQLVWRKSKNMGFIGSSKNKNSKYIDNNNMNNYLTHNNNNININSITTKNNLEKIKFSVNKKNLMNTIKKPSKIKIEKKNLKYKIPIELMNNFTNKNKLEMDFNGESNNNRKLNIKRKNMTNNRSFSNIKKNQNIIKYQNQNQNQNQNNGDNSKSFLESTLVAFNGLVSKAQQIGQILIDNKEIINANKDNNLISNKLKNSLEILNMDQKIDKLNKKIKNEQNTVEELQKINLDLNNKINLFNENSQQYENKVKELVDVINQLKQNNNNNGSNNNSNNGDNNNFNGGGNHLESELINKYIPSNENNNFTLERKPKKKKIKFGFVESIFMKPDKFQIINNKKPNEHKSKENESISTNKINKEPKLIVVNMNRNNNNDNIKYEHKDITNEEYYDAASQIANHLLIESLISIKNEDAN